MDPLDLLGDLPGGAAVQSEPSGVLSASTPKGIKRRRGLLANIDMISEASSPTSSATRTAGTQGTSGAGTPRQGQEDESCLGCGRGRNTCLSFFEPGGETEWGQPQRRGSWCKDCFNTHRTCYGSHPLSLFASWIQGQANRDEFEETLIGYVSLKVEGMERVTAAKVRERVEMLKFIFRFCGASMRSCVVVPLSEWVQRSSPPLVLPSRLISMLSGGKHVLGVLEPVGRTQHVGTIERPIGPVEALPCLHRHLACSDGSEVGLLTQALSAASGVCADTTLAVFQPAGSVAAGASDSSRRDILTVRLEVLQATCMTHLVCLSVDSWQQNFKETVFTSCLTKLHPLVADAASLGREDIHGVAQDLVTGMTAAKFFARAFRDYQKVLVFPT